MMSHNQEPYRLKAPTRQAIEDAIPFELYREDEEGNEQPVYATEDYSYHFIGKEVLQEAEYDSEGEMTKTPVLSEYVLADLRIYNDTEIDFPDEVEVLEGIETPMHGWI